MAFFSSSEMAQRDRVYVLSYPSGVVPDAFELCDGLRSESLTIVDMRMELLRIVEIAQRKGGPAQVKPNHILDLLRTALGKKGVVIFRQCEVPLAFFGEAARARLWKQILTEIIDVPGFGILLVGVNSGLHPPTDLAERFSHRLRGDQSA